MTRKSLFSITILLTVILGLSVQFVNRTASGKPGRKILYVTQSMGFRHASLHLSEDIIEQIGTANGYDVTLTHKFERFASPETLKAYDVIIFYTTGELPLSDAQKKAFLDWIRSGKGFIGLHSATDTYYKWPEYGEMIGGYFDGHPWTEKATVGISAFDRTNIFTSHFEESFKLQEEIYQFRNFNQDKVKVVMSLDKANTDMTLKGIKAAEFPLTWYRDYGKGRVFYTALGHRNEVWQDQRYQKMVLNAIRWAAGESEKPKQTK